MKILAITTIRADYDLMRGLYNGLNKDASIDFSLIVAGTHLSPTFGMTVNEIEKDGFNILAKSETLLDSDSLAGRLKSASLMLQNFIDPIENFKPDLILYAGDREDVMIGALIGAYLHIPTMHFFAGDHAADGHVDNPIRHATSKLSTANCASIEQHAERLRSIGEPNERVYTIGSIALDKFVAHKSRPLSDVFSNLNVNCNPDKFALIIFHPIEDEIEYASEIVTNIISLLSAKGIFCFVGAPNSDPNSRKLLESYEAFADDKNVCLYKNMSRDNFLTIFKQSELIVGNSSAGILEAASIPIPAINVGARQVGRLAGENVIFCGTDKQSISNAIEKAISPDFKSSIVNLDNLYGDGKSVENAIEIIKSIDFAKLLYKKEDPLIVKKGSDNE